MHINELLNLPNEFNILKNVTGIHLENLKNEMTSFRSRITKLHQQMELIIIDNDKTRQLNSNLIEFLIDASESGSKLLDNGERELNEWSSRLADYFCEDIVGFKLEECFNILFQFFEKMKQIKKDNSERKRLLKVKKLNSNNSVSSQNEQLKNSSQIKEIDQYNNLTSSSSSIAFTDDLDEYVSLNKSQLLGQRVRSVGGSLGRVSRKSIFNSIINPQQQQQKKQEIKVVNNSSSSSNSSLASTPEIVISSPSLLNDNEIKRSTCRLSGLKKLVSLYKEIEDNEDEDLFLKSKRNSEFKREEEVEKNYVYENNDFTKSKSINDNKEEEDNSIQMKRALYESNNIGSIIVRARNNRSVDPILNNKRIQSRNVSSDATVNDVDEPLFNRNRYCHQRHQGERSSLVLNRILKFENKIEIIKTKQQLSQQQLIKDKQKDISNRETNIITSLNENIEKINKEIKMKFKQKSNQPSYIDDMNNYLKDDGFETQSNASTSSTNNEISNKTEDSKILTKPKIKQQPTTTTKTKTIKTDIKIDTNKKISLARHNSLATTKKVVNPPVQFNTENVRPKPVSRSFSIQISKPTKIKSKDIPISNNNNNNSITNKINKVSCNAKKSTIINASQFNHKTNQIIITKPKIKSPSLLQQKVMEPICQDNNKNKKKIVTKNLKSNESVFTRLTSK
jgi:hypothetical protein